MPERLLKGCVSIGPRIARRLTALLIVLLWAGVSWASTNVSVSVSPESGTNSDVYILTVTVGGDDVESVGAPQFRESEYFSIASQGTSQRTTLINGRKASEVAYSFQLSPKKALPPGRYPVPPGFLSTGTQPVWLKRPEIIIAAEPSSVAKAVIGGVDFTQTVDKLNPYVGEQVVYRVDIAVHRPLVGAELGGIAFDGFLQESFDKGREVTKVVGSRQTKLFSQKEAIFPTAPGQRDIPQRVLSLKLQVRNDAASERSDLFDEIWGGFFDLNSYSTVVKKLFTKPLSILVRPLPEPHRPARGFIPVGAVSLQSEIDRTALKEGESATLHITLTGNANLRPLELQAPVGPDAAHFRFYPEKPKLNVSPEQDFIRYTKEFSVAVVPQKSGLLRLPVYEITTFDPQSGRYRELRSPELELTVQPDPQGKALVVSGMTPPSRSDRPNKEISILAEDLLPQHIGSVAIQPKSEWPRSIVLLILGAPAALLAYVYSRERKLRLAGDARLNAKQTALRRAVARLDRASTLEPQQAITEIELALRCFLGDRYGAIGSAMTPDEAVELAKSRMKDSDLSAELARELRALERMRYGGAHAAEAAALQPLITSLKELLARVEKERI